MVHSHLNAFLLAVLAQSGFSEAWYFENVLGQLERAAQEYQLIYLDPESSPELRRRAARRAARCAEKLGDHERARAIHDWLRVEEIGPEDSVEGAGVTERSVPNSGPDTATEQDPANAGGRIDAGALVAYREALVETAGRRRQALERLERRTRREAALRDRRLRLVSRLEREGVELRWTADGLEAGSGDEPSWRSRLSGMEILDLLEELDLEPDDVRLLREHLLHLETVRGLKALRAQDLARALRAFERCIQLATSRQLDLEYLVDSLRRILVRSEGLSRLAGRRLLETSRRRDAETLHAAESAYRDLLDRLEVGDNEGSAERLARARRLEDFTSREVREEGRLYDVRRQAIASLEGPASRPIREDLERVQQEAVRLADRLRKQIRVYLALEGAPGETARPRLEDPEVMAGRLRRFVQGILVEVEAARPGGSAGNSDPAAVARRAPDLREAVEDTLLLLDWFPDLLDPAGRLRSHFRSFLERSST